MSPVNTLEYLFLLLCVVHRCVIVFTEMEPIIWKFSAVLMYHNYYKQSSIVLYCNRGLWEVVFFFFFVFKSNALAECCCLVFACLFFFPFVLLSSHVFSLNVLN